jgi:hypothetical protein
MRRVYETATYIFSKPLEAIEFLTAFVLFLQALWLLSPFYVPSVSSVSQSGSYEFVVLFGVLQIILALYGLFALCALRWPKRVKARRTFTATAFGLFIFYAIAQVFLFGLTSVIYLSTALIALIMGICYLAQGRKDSG